MNDDDTYIEYSGDGEDDTYDSDGDDDKVMMLLLAMITWP